MTAHTGHLGGGPWSRRLGVRTIRVSEQVRGGRRVRTKREHGRHRTFVELDLGKGAGQTRRPRRDRVGE